MLLLMAFCLTVFGEGGGPSIPISTEILAGRMQALTALANEEPGSHTEILPSGTAVYVLNHVRTNFRDADGNAVIMVYGVTDSGGEDRDIRDGNYVWIPITTDEFRAQMFRGTDPGLFLEPTTDIRETSYIYTTGNIPVQVDDSWWVEFLSQSGLTEEECLTHVYSDRVPFTSRGSTTAATDAEQGCFEGGQVPQQRNGEPCPSRGEALELSPLMRSMIEEAAARHDNLDAATLATALHLETGNFNPFTENTTERNICLQQDGGGNCNDYRWGRGLGQFGANVAREYNLDWSNQNNSFELVCSDAGTSESCLRMLQQRCDEIVARGERAPVSCPRQSIDAMADHLSGALNDVIPVWIQKEEEGLRPVNLAPVLRRNPAEYTRALLSAYNRGPRVINSYVEFYNLNGRWPNSYGEAWSTPRHIEEFEGYVPPPDRNVGYQMLTNEFVNRCHMWAATGMCGEFREGSLINQYGRQFSE